VSENIFWVAQLKIRPGKLDDFMALMRDMVEATQANEPGALNYEWFISDDGTLCHIYERYADSAAVMAHVANLQTKFMERFMAALEPVPSTAYGNPDDQVKGVLSQFGMALMAPIGGFAR
jgi:quinol monooxygenase YgiN